jgi:hypothetical protein
MTHHNPCPKPLPFPPGQCASVKWALALWRVGDFPVSFPRHRLSVVHATSRNRGTPTCPGLRVLDHKPVTVVERLTAFQRHNATCNSVTRDVAAALFRCR